MPSTAVKERPIIFSGQMIRCLLNGTKTQTRRVVKPQPDVAVSDRLSCPFQVGMNLWVRETFDWIAGKVLSIQGGVTEEKQLEHIRYKADGGNPVSCQWTPSIYMPRWASRITLEITDVRVQRVQEISAQDVVAEGWPFSSDRDAFAATWDKLNAKRGHGWEANPWVWAITFRRIEE